MASRYAQRPRAPSPPRSPTFGRPSDTFDFFRPSAADKKLQPPLPSRPVGVQRRPPPVVDDHYDTDNTYSVVLDDQTVEFQPQKNGPTKAGRMFGDSEAENEEKKILNRRLNNIPNGSLSSNASSTSSRRGGSLSSLYQARKNGLANYDSATVEQIKAQFQAQIASMLQSQERNNNNNNNLNKSGQSPVKNGHIPSAAERELNGIRDLQRGKSFVEARTAVQKQIERMFSSATATSTGIGSEKSSNHHEISNAGGGQNPKDRDVLAPLMTNGSKFRAGRIQHTMHGVSHALPGDELDIEPPPPVHYGIDQALRNGSVALNSRRTPQQHQDSVKNFFSNEDLRNVGRPDQISFNMSKNLASKQRLTQSQDSLRFADDIDIDTVPSPFLVGEDVRKPERQQHLGNIDVAVSTSQQRSISRSTDAESPTSVKTGVSSFPSSRSSPASPPQRNATAQTPKIETRAPTNIPGALKKQYVRHKVDYLGALPITSSKSTNLSALQRPLKDLYFKWRALRNLGQTNLPGTLEINDTGLTVQYIRELHKGVQEIFNPFPTIAVWAAVKFVHRRDLVQGDPQQGPRGGLVPGGNYVLHRYAFLPLISDPEGNDKSRLYHELEGEHEVELAADSPHPPLFACVMRRTGGQKILECHGFVCSTSEDAIIIAANLYQALLETMKKQKSQKSDRRREEQTRGEDQQSVQTGSMFSDSDATTNTNTTPVRPPRRKKGSRGTDGSSSGSGMLQRRRSLRSSIRSNRSTKSNGRRRAGPSATNTIGFVPDHPFRRSNTRLGRSDSGRKSDFSRRSSRRLTRPDPSKGEGASSSRGLGPPPSSMKGDVYTRVAIPRSKSFMNVSSQYNLQELFRELKEKEGVESIDDVLKKIISPNGISFNEIKPVYRELLLKLAMTMSQDEIFQRSKNIIQQEKKKQKSKKQKQKGKKSYPTSASEQSTLSSFLRMTFSSSKSQHQTLEKSSGTIDPAKRPALVGTDTNTKSSSSGKALTKADISGPIPLSVSLPAPTGLQVTPSKTPLMSRSTKVEAANKPLPPKPSTDEFVDDAYVSCSECGYESVCNYEACSSCGPKPLSRSSNVIEHTKLSGTKIEDCDSVCDCDGDSCVSSEKCYCSLRGDPRQKTPNKLKHKQPAKLMTIHSDDGESSSCCSGHSACAGKANLHTSSPDIVSTDSGTDTTCHLTTHKAIVNTHRAHNPRDTSLSRVESPQTAWRKNSSVTSWHPRRPESCVGSDYSDALPLSQIGISSASVISSGSSSINSCRICQINHVKHHCCLSDDEGHSSPLSCELHRKNSGGSGYQSNDSNSPPQTSPNHSHHQHRHSHMHHNRIKSLSQDNLTLLTSGSIRSGCSCSSTSCSGSIASRGSLQRLHHHGRPRLSLAKSSSHLLMDIDTPLTSHPKRSLSQQKVLLVQAVDRSGKVVYRGASNSSLNDTDVVSSTPSKPDTRATSNSNVGNSSSSNNVMSMKKSAEIAAVFSGAKINQTTNIVDHYADDQRHQHQHHQHSFSEANMHSSLGYFP